jgi:hypothetical protein
LDCRARPYSPTRVSSGAWQIAPVSPAERIG